MSKIEIAVSKIEIAVSKLKLRLYFPNSLIFHEEKTAHFCIHNFSF